MYDAMTKLIAQNPIMQFSKADGGNSSGLLSERQSASLLGSGLGQFTGARQTEAIRKQQLRFGLMKFQMNGKGAL